MVFMETPALGIQEVRLHIVWIALWSHQSAQTANSGQCIVQIVNVPQRYTPKAVVIDNHLPRQPLISSYVPDWPLPPRVYIPSESEMALRARIYAYNRHQSFDVAFICSTLTHCGVCHLSVWRLKWEVGYVHQSVWRWKWFFCQSNYVLQRQNVRYCFPTGNRFTAAVGLWNML